MTVKNYSILFFLLLLTFKVSSAQNKSFDKILSQEGEANLSVRQIIQDDDGVLWIATFSGLYKYEGDEFVVQQRFRNNEQINNDVVALLKDLNNNIWIGTNHGLSKYNLITEELITYYHSEKEPGSISSDKIRSLQMDKRGRIFIGTYDSGVNVYDSLRDGFIKIEFKNTIGNSRPYVKSILFGNDGKIWVGTFGDGVFSFTYSDSKIDSLQNYRIENDSLKLTSNDVYCLFQDTDSKIAIGTRNGINLFDPQTNRFNYYSFTGSPMGEMGNFFRTITRDQNGKLWIGTWGGLILCKQFEDLTTGNFDLFVHDRKDNQSISHAQIMDFFEDKSGCMWIGTENGLNKYDLYQNQFEQVSGESISQLPEQTATAFHPYKNGHLILTLSHGILFSDETSISNFPGTIGFEQFEEKLYAILIDSKKNIWAGSYNGVLIKMDGKTQDFSTYKHSPKNTPIYSLAEDANGNILVGTGGEGLKYFNPRTKRFTAENGLSGDVQINDILIDKNRSLWIATQLGVFKRKAGLSAFEYYLPDQSDSILNPNIFNDIEESASGEIFVGGRNGFYLYNEQTNTFKSKKFPDVGNLWVTNIQLDSQQSIWLNLNFNRIARWEPTTDQIRFFSVNNGTRSSQYNRRGFFIDKNDQLYLSGFDQIYRFNTSEPLNNAFSPKPIFNKLIVNNTEIQVGTQLNGQLVLSKNLNRQDELVLNHQNKDFTLGFTSTSYVNTRENKYKYILHGYDKEWHTGTERLAHYTNLSRGKYIFEVFAANNDGVWSEESAKLIIRVKPSPFLSSLALFIYFIIAIAVFIQSRRVILARIQLKRELLIERVKREKEEKFNNERLRFYTNISHELRTPLTLIMGPIKQLISEEKADGKTSKLHDLILNNSQRLLSLVNQFLDFRKSLFEGMKLKTIQLNIVEAIESNIAAFEYMAKEKSIDLTFTNDSAFVTGWFDQEKLDIMIFNILSNAFKYTPEYGRIKIELRTGEQNIKFPSGYVELKITDNGKGIPKQFHEKIFERFYQIKEESGALNTGSGIGLSFVKTLVELHHGEIKLDSVPGETCFTIHLPLGKDLYSEEEIFDFKRDADRRTKELLTHSYAKNDPTEIPEKSENKPRILLIEDNLELRDFLRDLLSEEYQIYTASNGVDGLKICVTENPNLVISDVMMDQMDGLQFCENLKSNSEISHIPVILMTALTSIESKISGYKMGADDYITKPFEPELLKIRIRNILDNFKKLKAGFGSHQEVTSKELTFSKIDEDFLNRVIELIDKNLDNSEFDIENLCKGLGVSSSQLYRKIKSITDLSPVEFVRTYRLKKAALLIKESELRISEIAYRVGFNDALYFSKCFKKQFGISPSKYPAGE
ncbi:two-component regulator propeller domain-containing protein [Mangrovibacterium sp.]|uniref:hybrid sensor histidine kinase/response regulator transcription factor n=1 Tax=Mangrovibacterium sp. TaxID=1961364 RepID=UPI003564FE9E